MIRIAMKDIHMGKMVCGKRFGLRLTKVVLLAHMLLLLDLGVQFADYINVDFIYVKDFVTYFRA